MIFLFSAGRIMVMSNDLSLSNLSLITGCIACGSHCFSKLVPSPEHVARIDHTDTKLCHHSKIGWRENIQKPLNLETNKHGFLQSSSSNQSIESQEIAGKRGMLCKESSIMMKKTRILSQNWFDTLVSRAFNL